MSVFCPSADTLRASALNEAKTRSGWLFYLSIFIYYTTTIYLRTETAVIMLGLDYTNCCRQDSEEKRNSSLSFCIVVHPALSDFSSRYCHERTASIPPMMRAIVKTFTINSGCNIFTQKCDDEKYQTAVWKLVLWTSQL